MGLEVPGALNWEVTLCLLACWGLVCVRLEGGQGNKQGTAGGDEGLGQHCLGVGCVCQGTAGATEGGWIRVTARRGGRYFNQGA